MKRSEAYAICVACTNVFRLSDEIFRMVKHLNPAQIPDAQQEIAMTAEQFYLLRVLYKQLAQLEHSFPNIIPTDFIVPDYISRQELYISREQLDALSVSERSQLAHILYWFPNQIEDLIYKVIENVIGQSTTEEEWKQLQDLMDANFGSDLTNFIDILSKTPKALPQSTDKLK